MLTRIISIILAIWFLRRIILKMKYGRILDEDTILKVFLKEDEKILWSEREYTRRSRTKNILSVIGIILIFSMLIILIYWNFESMNTTLIFSMLWWESFIYLINVLTLGLIFCIWTGVLLFNSKILSDKVYYYLSNQRVFSCYMRWKDKHIMVFDIKNIESYDYKEKLGSSDLTYTIYFKTSELTDEEINKSILFCYAEKDEIVPKKYNLNLKIDDGWSWCSDTNESVIIMKSITKKDEILMCLENLKIYHQKLPENWKDLYGYHPLKYFY